MIKLICASFITSLLFLSACYAETQCITVEVSAYTSDPDETDKSPRLTASGKKLQLDDNVVAVSRDLEAIGFTFGRHVSIEKLPGTFEIGDRTHERWEKRVDLYMGKDKKRALEWGVKQREVCIAGN